MHVEVSPQVLYMCRGHLAQLLVSEVVCLRAYGLLKSFAKTFNRYSFLKFKNFYYCTFHVRGLNYLGFIDLGIFLVLQLKLWKYGFFSVFFYIGPFFYHTKFQVPASDLLFMAEVVGRTSGVQSWKCRCLAVMEGSIINFY